MKDQVANRTARAPNRGSSCRISLLSVGFIVLMLSILTPRPARADSDLASASRDIADRLTAEISATPEGAGKVIFVVPPVGLVVEFEGAGARSDREYLLTRQPEKAEAAFPIVIGVVRLSALREEKARGVVLWAMSAPRPGDKLIPPSHVTVFILPAKDLAHHPDAPASVVDQAFEIALSREKKLRVVRLQSKPDPEELAKRLQIAGETGVLLQPIILPDPGGIRVAAKALSVLSGHTLASYDESVKLLPRIARPAPPPSASPSPGFSPPSAGQPGQQAPSQTVPAPTPQAQEDTAPPGFVFTRKKEEPGEIVPESERDGPVRKKVDEMLIAITAADLDGDGRSELVGITEKEVFTYRWTKNKGFAPITGHIEPNKLVKYLAVDAADINGNGRDEIFVTAISSVPAGIEFRNKLHSKVLELNTKLLKPVARKLPYFLRVVRAPGHDRPMLLAQKMGKHQPSRGPILTMTWKGNAYVPEGSLAVAEDDAWIYKFSIVEVGDEGATAVASINWKGKLRVFRDGEMAWEGKDNLGPVEHTAFLQTPRAIQFKETLRMVTQPRPKEIAKRRVLARRILAAPPLFGKGKIELITVANRVHYGVQLRLFGEPFGAASVVGYIDSGEEFEKNWETEPVEGEARDLTVADFDGDGRRDVVLLSALEEEASLDLFLLLRPGIGAGPVGGNGRATARAQ
ncbi:MAG: FG-GAP-like repeat-containing protein [Candidatus Methylomirabilales bacterium]